MFEKVFLPKLSKRLQRELEHTRHRLVGAQGLLDIAAAEVTVYEQRIVRLKKQRLEALSTELEEANLTPPKVEAKLAKYYDELPGA